MDDQAFMTDDLRIFDTTTGNLLGIYFTDYFYFPSVAISPDGNTLFVLNSSVGVVAVDVSTDTPSLGPSVSIAPAYRDLWVNWHGNKLFVGNRIYDLPALTLSGQLSIGATTVTTSPSDRTIVSGNSFDPTIYFWRASSLSEYGTFTLLGGTNFVRILPYDGTIISAPGGGVELDMIHKVH